MGIIRSQGIKNSIISYVGTAIGFISLIILQPIFLSAEEIGLIRILFSTSYLVSTFIPLGVANVITRYFPIFRNPEKNNHGFLGFIFLFMLLGTLIVFVLQFFIKDFFFLQYQQESPLFTEYYYVIFPFSVALAMITILNMYCYSLYKTAFASLINDILIRILSIVLFSIYYLKLISISTLVYLFIGIYGLQTIILISYLIKEKAFNIHIDINFIKQNHLNDILKYAMVFLCAPIASYGIKFFDGIIMGKYLKLDMVGIYSIMSFIPSFMEAPLLALEKIANPKISDALNRNDFDNIKEIYYKSCRFLLAIGGLLMICIYINIEYLLTFMKPEYLQGINVVFIIGMSTLFNLSTGTNNAIVYNSKNYIFGTVSLVGIMTLTLVLNIIFIPIWGMEGAAIATAFSSFLFNLVKYLFIRVKFKLQPFDFRNLQILLALIVSLITWHFLPEIFNLYISAFYKTFITLLEYLSIIYFTKSITVAEIKK